MRRLYHLFHLHFLMAQGAQFFTLLLYAVLSLAGGFLAVWLGYTLLKAV